MPQACRLLRQREPPVGEARRRQQAGLLCAAAPVRWLLQDSRPRRQEQRGGAGSGQPVGTTQKAVEQQP